MIKTYKLKNIKQYECTYIVYCQQTVSEQFKCVAFSVIVILERANKILTRDKQTGTNKTHTHTRVPSKRNHFVLK